MIRTLVEGLLRGRLHAQFFVCSILARGWQSPEHRQNPPACDQWLSGIHQFFATLWTVAHQAVHGLFQARTLEWVAIFRP